MDPRKQQYENNKVQKRLRHAIGKAISDYNLIEEADRLMVCLSGGKDSYVLLDILLSLQQKAPVHFDIVCVHLDAGIPGYPKELMDHYLKDKGVEYKIIHENVFDIVKEKIPDGKNICSLCSRLRRGILYRVADEVKATKLVLGHHREDLLETMLLNFFYSGQLKSMPPKLLTDDGRHIVIRPMIYCCEKDIIKYAQIRQYPIISGELCSFHANQQRQVIKEMLKDWEKKNPGRLEIMARSLQNVKISHLQDNAIFNFQDLKVEPATPPKDENPASQDQSNNTAL